MSRKSHGLEIQGWGKPTVEATFRAGEGFLDRFPLSKTLCLQYSWSIKCRGWGPNALRFWFERGIQHFRHRIGGASPSLPLRQRLRQKTDMPAD